MKKGETASRRKPEAEAEPEDDGATTSAQGEAIDGVLEHSTWNGKTKRWEKHITWNEKTGRWEDDSGDPVDGGPPPVQTPNPDSGT